MKFFFSQTKRLTHKHISNICFHFQDAKETLLDPAKRANYDKWRNSGIKISYKNWLGMKEHVHQVINQFFLIILVNINKIKLVDNHIMTLETLYSLILSIK